MNIFSFLLAINTAEASQSINLAIGGQAFTSGAGQFIKPGNYLSLGYLTGSKIQYGLQLSQSIHNGNYYEEQAALGCGSTGTCIQGDSMINTVSGILRLHTSKIDLDILPSITSVPLLMDQVYYEEKIVPTFGAISTVHQGLKPGASVRLSANRSTKDKSISYGIYAMGSFTVGIGSSYGFGAMFQSR